MWVGAGLWHDTGLLYRVRGVASAPSSSGRCISPSVPTATSATASTIRSRRSRAAPRASTSTCTIRRGRPSGSSHQAREHRIDAALVLHPRSMKPSATGRLFIERALEEAGIPVLPIEADVVDARELGSGGDARRRPRRFSTSGCRNDDDRSARRPRRTGCCPSASTLVAMFTLQLSNLGFSPLLPSIQQDVRHELHAARTLHRALRPARDAAQRAGRNQRAPFRREARARARPRRRRDRQRAARTRRGASSRRSRFAASRSSATGSRSSAC